MTNIPDTAIDRLFELLWLQGLSEQAAKTEAKNIINDAIDTITSVGGKIVWEDVA